MNTKIIRIDDLEEEQEHIIQAGNIVKQGGLVAFPTETVYGLGGDAFNTASAGKIYAAKKRPSDNPLIIHVCRIDDLRAVADNIPPAAYKLAERFWPGPLTMIFQKSDRVPYETTGGLSTVAVRMPGHKAALSFIQAAGGFVAAPSANVSGRPSPTLAKYVIEDMDGRIDMILDGGETDIGIESTIVDMTQDVPMILRPGSITKQMLEDVLGEIAIDRTILKEDGNIPPKAPGMKYRHYAPKGKLTIIEGSEEEVVCYINEQTARYKAAGEKTGVIGSRTTIARYRADSVKNVGERGDEACIARCLYRILRELDDENVTIIYTESFPATGMGQAVMNRLLKAAGHQLIGLNKEDDKNDSIGQ